jgi:DMSO/TMAO reductase YedYZ molybdopterin-dependent catalytic subunit
VVRGFPVLHVGTVPEVDLGSWRLTVDGLVGRPVSLGYEDIRLLPSVTLKLDFHCVTTWSILDRSWTGVRFSELASRVEVLREATHVVAHGAGDYSTNIPLADLMRDDVLLCWGYEGQDLSADHGYPLRLIVPHLYAWKSCKWLNRLEVCSQDKAGFWEKRGYHNYGDPWREQRFDGDS